MYKCTPEQYCPLEHCVTHPFIHPHNYTITFPSCHFIVSSSYQSLSQLPSLQWIWLTDPCCQALWEGGPDADPYHGGHLHQGGCCVIAWATKSKAAVLMEAAMGGSIFMQEIGIKVLCILEACSRCSGYVCMGMYAWCCEFKHVTLMCNIHTQIHVRLVEVPV